VTAFDTVVVGGGVVGCATAYYAARAGLRVVLLERGDLASEASGVNPGVVSLATKAPGRASSLALASRALFDELERDLRPFALVRGGSLVVFEDAAEEAYARDHCARLGAAGIDLEIVDGAQARRIQPILSPDVCGAISSPTDLIVDPRALTEALADAARGAGADIRLRESALGLVQDDDRIVGVRTPTGSIAARWIVNAAGLGAAKLGSAAGIRHPVAPRKGQLMSVTEVRGVAPVRVTSVRELMHKHATHAASSAIGIGLTPKGGGTVILGGTTEDVGLDATVEPLVTAGIALAAVRLFPSLGSARPIAAWCGFRPYAAGGPLLGPEPGHPGYLVAAGHGGDGVALAPVSGAYLAAVMTRGADLTVEAFLGER